MAFWNFCFGSARLEDNAGADISILSVKECGYATQRINTNDSSVFSRLPFHFDASVISHVIQANKKPQLYKS